MLSLAAINTTVVLVHQPMFTAAPTLAQCQDVATT
jgi:hypothetical protein